MEFFTRILNEVIRMPDFDGTGPRGNGAFTGRGRGFCVSGLGKVFKNASHGVKLFSLVVPAVTAIVMDARKPDGITRRLMRSTMDKLGRGKFARNIKGVRVESIEENQNK